MSDPGESGPYDWKRELAGVDYDAVPGLEVTVARDGTPLAFRRYDSAADIVVVALHGSSAEGSYFHPMATQLSSRNRASFVVPDLRGHGASGGRRGDVDYVGQLEDDLADLLDAVRRRRRGAKLVLLGHSSGGGLAVRFAGGRRDARVDGYVLLAPFLGSTAPTTRPASGGWTEVDGPRIAALARRAVLGDTSGQDQIVLRFNKPPSQRTGREVLAYTFRMVLSYQPRPDLAGDLSAIEQPLLVLAGERDESFVPEQYEPTISPHARGNFKVLPALGHLGLVVDPRTAEEVGAWLATIGEPHPVPQRDATHVPRSPP
jgi:alpha-beta hydrolase superfamily lysophospholipase